MAYATTQAAPLFFLRGNIVLFLRSLTVAAHELVYATCSIHELALTGIEGVRGARDFDFNHWVSFAFEFYGVISLCGRTRKEHIAVGHVLEHDGAIVIRKQPNFPLTFYSSSTMISLCDTSSTTSSTGCWGSSSFTSVAISSASSPFAASSCWRLIRRRKL